MYVISSKVRHAMERFSEHAPMMRQLLSENEQFTDLCTEYGEAVEAIRYWSSSGDPNAHERVAEFQQVRDELEEELRTELLRVYVLRAHEEPSGKESK